MKYDIVTANSHEDLFIEVNKAIHLGWKPTGGVAVSVTEGQYENERDGCTESYRSELWAQAMISTIARDDATTLD